MNQLRKNSSLMGNVFKLLVMILLPSFGWSQADTVHFDLQQSSMSKRKCNNLILKKWYFSISHIPSSFTAQDSAVFENSDTVYLKVFDGKQLRYEGLKLPQWDLVGWVNFYNRNGDLKKSEFRTHELFASNGEDSVSEGGDGMTTSKKIYYKNGVPRKKKVRDIHYTSELGFYRSVTKYKFYDGKIYKFKIRNYIYSID